MKERLIHLDSKSKNKRYWCSGNMRAFQALVTGSNPVYRSIVKGEENGICSFSISIMVMGQQRLS